MHAELFAASCACSTRLTSVSDVGDLVFRRVVGSADRAVNAVREALADLGQAVEGGFVAVRREVVGVDVVRGCTMSGSLMMMSVVPAGGATVMVMLPPETFIAPVTV